jgi:aryl-alcohol dehydrogenase-like predicted oxidoreductase
VRAIHRALELGVNFFDVAPGYGHGKAEEVLGRALHGRQEQVVVATKVRLAAEEMHDVAGAVRTSVEASLRRLRRETVDVLHVHNRFTPRRGDLPHALSADDALGPVLDAYQQMQHTGKTRFIGISAMEPDVPTVRRIITSGHFDTVLAYYKWQGKEAHAYADMVLDG